jgi:hypothetical protein
MPFDSCFHGITSQKDNTLQFQILTPFVGVCLYRMSYAMKYLKFTGALFTPDGSSKNSDDLGS